MPRPDKDTLIQEMLSAIPTPLTELELLRQHAKSHARDYASLAAKLDAADRTVAQQAEEIARLKKALRYAREPLAIAATYDADGETVGLRLHARDCAQAVTTIDSALSEGTRT